MSGPRPRFAIVLAALLLVTSFTELASTRSANAQLTKFYDVVDLGTLINTDIEVPDTDCPGMEGSITSVNNNRLAVGFYPPSTAKMSPALYLGGTLLRLEAGKGGGQARGIDNDGVVVGVIYDSPRTDLCKLPTGRSAVIWYGQDRQDLATPDGTSESQANDLNDSGLIVGWIVQDGLVLPVTWHEGGASELALPAVKDDEADEGQALAVDPDGNIAGYARWRDENGEVVRQTGVVWRGDDPVRLETLGNKLGNVATDLNVAGTTIGYARTEQDKTVAVYWEGDQIEQLPEISLSSESEALSINGAGEIVGYAVGQDGKLAVLWSGGEAINLNALIEPEGGLVLIEAAHINEKGEISAVALDESGVRHGVILTPVEAAG